MNVILAAVLFPPLFGLSVARLWPGYPWKRGVFFADMGCLTANSLEAILSPSWTQTIAIWIGVAWAIYAGWDVFRDQGRRIAKLIGAKAKAVRDAIVRRMPRARTLAPVPVAAAVLILGLTGTAQAQQVHPGQPVTTCQQQATYQAGPFRADNDLFAGAPGVSCMTVSLAKGGAARIRLTNACTPWGDRVASYRQLRYGSRFASHDPGSELPLRLGDLDGLTFHAAVTGRPDGHWIDDLDGWLNASGDPRAAATAEVVVGVASRGWAAGATPVKVGRHWYLEESHMTALDGTPWRLTTFRPRRQARHRAIPAGPFLRWMADHGLIARSDYLLSMAFGQECWNGGGGQLLTLRLSGLMPEVSGPAS